MHLDLRDRNRGLQDARRNRAGEYFVEEEGKMRRHQDEYQIGDIKEDLVRREEMTRGPAANGSVSAGVGRHPHTDRGQLDVNDVQLYVEHCEHQHTVRSYYIGMCQEGDGARVQRSAGGTSLRR